MHIFLPSLTRCRWWRVLLPATVCCLWAASLHGQASEADLRERIAQLEAELAAARAELAERGEGDRTATGPPAEATEPAPSSESPTVRAVPPEDRSVRFGDFKLGGAIRANWTLGDYETEGRGPSRGGEGGDVSLDTFRLNLSYAHGPFFSGIEYRWYPGTRFFHTAELGYRWDEDTVLKAGLTRVPFGVGPYGPANNWFFDQHYYVGLADDMDLGAVFTTRRGDWTLDLGLFARSEPDGRGVSKQAARYSFDIVAPEIAATYFGDQVPTAYTERGQANLRLVRHFDALPIPTDLGLSLQYGRLDGRQGLDDGDAWAASLHSRSTLGPWALMLQATRYDYDSAEDYITGGFYDYSTDIAAEGTVLSAALSYTWEPGVEWLDSVTFYNDYSVIRKDAPGYRDSALNVLGAAFAKGGWYIYADWAYSDGNEFVGEFRPGMWADNDEREWQSRLNLNLGYYF